LPGISTTPRLPVSFLIEFYFPITGTCRPAQFGEDELSDDDIETLSDELGERKAIAGGGARPRRA
jgi:hypothetical protein